MLGNIVRDVAAMFGVQMTPTVMAVLVFGLLILAFPLAQDQPQHPPGPQARQRGRPGARRGPPAPRPRGPQPRRQEPCGQIVVAEEAHKLGLKDTAAAALKLLTATGKERDEVRRFGCSSTPSRHGSPRLKPPPSCGAGSRACTRRPGPSSARRSFVGRITRRLRTCGGFWRRRRRARLGRAPSGAWWRGGVVAIVGVTAGGTGRRRWRSGLGSRWRCGVVAIVGVMAGGTGRRRWRSGLGSRWGLAALSVVARTTRLGRPLITRGSGSPSWDRSPRPVQGRGSLRIRRPLARHALRPPPELPRRRPAPPACGADPGAGRGDSGSRGGSRARGSGSVGRLASAGAAQS
jgi:hypothetical protein